jgi:hypothetical protein
MLNFRQCFFAISLLLAVFNHASFAAQYSEEERRAAVNAENHKKQTLQALQDCVTFHIGPANNYFKFLEYVWASSNQSISMAADDVLASSAVDAKRAADSGASPKIAAADPQICDALSKKTRSLQLDFANVYPADAKLLSAIFEANAAWKIKLRNADFTVGCVKSYWSRGEKEFDEVKSSCECQTGVLLKSATEQQISAWVSDIGLLGVEAATLKESNSWLKSVIKQTAESCSR